MLGIINALFIGTVFAGKKISDSRDNTKCRREAAVNGKLIYLDSYGRDRSTLTGNIIYRSVHNNDGDVVDVDSVTGQVLRNYSAEKRNFVNEQAKKHRQNTINNKKEAIEKGSYFYTDENKRDPKYKDYFMPIYGSRRVSDDLELVDAYFQSEAKDAKYKLYVLNKHNEETAKDWNWKIINNANSELRRDCGTVEAAEAYARKLGAIL